MSDDKEWKTLIVAQLNRHERKLDVLIESMAGMKVKVAAGAALIAALVSFLVKHLT